MGITFLIKALFKKPLEPISYITLSFPKEQEKDFQKKYYQDSKSYIRIVFVLVTILYGAFAIVDTILAGEFYKSFLYIRYLVVMPFLIMVLILTYTKIFEKIWQGLLLAAFLITGSGIVFMIQMIPHTAQYYMGLMLVLSAGYFCIKLRFILASAAGWMLLLIFNLVMNWYTDISTEFVITANFFYVSANLFSMIASYYIELYNRRNYLISLKLENKTNELEVTNKNLEELVFLRTKALADNESVLREKMELFQALFNASPDAIFLIDPNDTQTSWPIIDCNDEACKMNGYIREEMIGKSIDLLNTREETTEERIAYSDKVKKGKIIRIETTHRHKNGHIFPIEVSTSIINVGGKELILGIDRDITERKLIEESLRKTEKYYRTLIERAPDGFMLIGIDGKMKFASPSAIRMFGYSDADTELPDPDENTHPDDLPDVLKTLEKVYLNPSVVGNHKYRFRKKDGTWLWIESTFTNQLSEDPINAIVINFRDITERKMATQALRESEKNYRQLINGMNETVWVIGFDGIILDINNRAVEIFEYSKEYLVGSGLDLIDKYLSPGEITKLIENIPIVKMQSFETWHTTKSGISFPVEINSSLITYNGQPAILSIARDITRRKQIEEEIKRLNTELEIRVEKRTEELLESNKELEAFAYSVSHDLRSPLRAINSFTAILNEDHINQEDTEAIRLCLIIRDNTSKMSTLIDGLLNFSRLGRTALQKSTINIGQMAESVFLEIAEPHEREKIRFINSIRSKAFGDYMLINQVWVNLISNAIKFTSHKPEPEIIISSKPQNGHLLVSIKDNGAGFDMRYADKLFGVFHRAHNDNEFTGTGVGLALVQRIIHRHGGNIWAEGEPGMGATFYFTLPREKKAKSLPKDL